MNVKRKFLHDRGIYGRVEVEGLSISRDCPFIVAKDAGGKWSVYQERSGMSVAAVLPPRIVRSKARLLLWLSDMAREIPETMALIGLVESKEMLADEFADEARALIAWSEAYKCV